MRTVRMSWFDCVQVHVSRFARTQCARACACLGSLACSVHVSALVVCAMCGIHAAPAKRQDHNLISSLPLNSLFGRKLGSHSSTLVEGESPSFLQRGIRSLVMGSPEAGGLPTHGLIA